METHFQQELNQLKSELLRMAGLVERAISNAIEALVKRDTPLAEKTIKEDDAKSMRWRSTSMNGV